MSSVSSGSSYPQEEDSVYRHPPPKTTTKNSVANRILSQSTLHEEEPHSLDRAPSQGEFLQYKYQYKGKLYATELATREATVSFAQIALAKTVEYLRTREETCTISSDAAKELPHDEASGKDDLTRTQEKSEAISNEELFRSKDFSQSPPLDIIPSDSPSISSISSEEQEEAIQENTTNSSKTDQLIEEYVKTAESTEIVGSDWIGSNYFRNVLKAAAKEGAGAIKEAFENTFVGGLVNFRYHSCSIEGSQQEVGFFRLGVITDPRNGFTHLKELQKFRKNGPEDSEYTKKLKSLEEHLKSLEKKPQANTAKIISLQHAIHDLQHLDKAIRERQKNLSLQMLHLVTSQITKNFPKIGKQDEHFTIAHLGLLNPFSENLDSTGWKKHEGYETLDMEAIFEEFNGKTLIFDGAGPFIDEHGNIHLDKKMTAEDGSPRTLTLNTILANISVQGHMQNDGIQQKINQKAIALIESYLVDAIKNNYPSTQEAESLFKSVKQRLSAGISNYLLAEDLSKVALLIGLPFSVGCLSAKDRTGLVGGRTILYFINKSIDTQTKDPKLQKKLKEKFAVKIVSAKGLAAQVIHDNTGEKVLKCSPFTLPGVSDGIKGKFRRVTYFAKQAKVFIKPAKPPEELPIP